MMAAQISNNSTSKSKKAGDFFKGLKSEIKKITWPTRKELVKHTLVVIVACVFVALLLWVLDTAFHGLFSLILGK